MPLNPCDRHADDQMNPSDAHPPSLKRLLVSPPDDLLEVALASPLSSAKDNSPRRR